MGELESKVVADLLERVIKLEKGPNINELAAGLDRVAYSHLVSVNGVIALLIEKNIITSEELQKAIAAEHQRIDLSMKENKEGTSDIKTNQGTEEPSTKPKE